MPHKCGPSTKFPGFQTFEETTTSYCLITPFCFGLKIVPHPNHLFAQIGAVFKNDSILHGDGDLLPGGLSEGCI